MITRVLALGLVAGLATLLFWQKPNAAPRDIAVVMPSPDAPVLKITVLGTSLTATYDWPDRVADTLALCLGGRPQISRIALAGANSTWGLSQIHAVIATQPDIILIEFAINDADLRDGVWLWQSAANHRAMGLALQTALPDSRVVLMTMSPAQGVRGWLRPWLGQYYAQYQRLAQDMGAGLIDLYPRWLAVPRAQRGLGRDGLHPDPNVAAKVIVPVITVYLRAALAFTACPA